MCLPIRCLGKYFRFLFAALLAAGLGMALIHMAQKPGSIINPPAAPLAAAPETPPFTAASKTLPAPAAPAIQPLGRSLEGITTRYRNIKPSWIEPIISGPLEGGTVRKYTTGSGTDDLYTLGGEVYRRVMSFRLAEILEQVEGTHANFSGLVFTYGLYPSAFDKEYDASAIPPEVKKLADAYGEKCGALAEPGARTAEHRETHGGYVFYCTNRDTTRLIYGVCSDGLLAVGTAAAK